MGRVDHATEVDGFEYEALPHHWDPPLQVKETGLLSQCLIMLRDWLTDDPPSAVRPFRHDDGATLYGRVASGWSDQAFAILEVSSASSGRNRRWRSHRSCRVCRSPCSWRE